MLSMPAYATSQDILPSPGQPRFPEYATQQGLFLTLTSIGKLHFNAPVLSQLQRACWDTLVLLLEE
jgi:hypothetical protein